MAIKITVTLSHCNAVEQTCFLRAFLGKKFGGTLKNTYLCSVNEKRRNLRPNQTTNVTRRAGNCSQAKSQNGVYSAISKINQQTSIDHQKERKRLWH